MVFSSGSLDKPIDAELLKWLRNVGNDFDPDDEQYECWPECSVMEEKDEDGFGHCPTPKDCGLCRYMYMRSKGWLPE